MKKQRGQLLDISKNNTLLSSFERKVYKAVSGIPSGEVRSYGWVARKIGRPRSSRAVGNALNKNPFIGIVPCHRVVRSDGSIGGFARGPRRKYLMLKDEGLTRCKVVDIIKKTGIK